LPWLSLSTGVVLAIVGGRLLAGGWVEALAAERLGVDAVNRTGLLGYAAYGLAFALSSLGCALPLFLVVIGMGRDGRRLGGGLGQLLLYALGMSAVMSVLTVLFGLSGRPVQRGCVAPDACSSRSAPCYCWPPAATSSTTVLCACRMMKLRRSETACKATQFS